MQIHDPSEDWLDPRIAATNLLQMLARYRQKDTLPKLLPFMEGISQTIFLIVNFEFNTQFNYFLSYTFI